MTFGDRFWTPATAKAILSWRILLGVGVGVAAGFLGLGPIGGVIVGVAAYAGTVLLAMPRHKAPPAVDPFTVSEPWRHFVQDGQRARRRLLETVRSMPAGPMRDRLQSIADRLDSGLAEGWQVARRGHDIDAAVKQLDPTRLRSRLATLQSQAAGAPSGDLDAAIASVESQLATSDRLKQLSATTADRLRLTQARLDELCARAAEVSIGSSDTDRFAHDVDDLVLELEGLRQAVQELPS